jgi:hypothetical protein
MQNYPLLAFRTDSSDKASLKLYDLVIVFDLKSSLDLLLLISFKSKALRDVTINIPNIPVPINLPPALHCEHLLHRLH